jgi:hypothetical protein
MKRNSVTLTTHLLWLLIVYLTPVHQVMWEISKMVSFSLFDLQLADSTTKGVKKSLRGKLKTSTWAQVRWLVTMLWRNPLARSGSKQKARRGCSEKRSRVRSSQVPH